MFACFKIRTGKSLDIMIHLLYNIFEVKNSA